MQATEQNKWRTLICVVGRIEEEGVVLLIPAWNPSVEVEIGWDLIPGDIAQLMVPRYRCFARGNIGAERAEDLRFEDWEDWKA